MSRQDFLDTWVNQHEGVTLYFKLSIANCHIVCICIVYI
jgi:hypothetical protein